MLMITNKQVSDMIRECERLIKTGSERLRLRKGIQRGLNEVNQGIGGLRVVQQALNSSIEAKTFNLNY